MKIDPINGKVTFPNGCSIGSDCTQDEFRGSALGADARSWDCGTLPWIHYDFKAGEIEDHDLIVRLCFYDQLLVSIDLTICLYQPDQRDWLHYSLDTEAAQKALHERILCEQFGKSSTKATRSSNRFPGKRSTLNESVVWGFKWGKVSSCHDSKGGGTFIQVRYGDRLERSAAAYRSRRK